MGQSEIDRSSTEKSSRAKNEFIDPALSGFDFFEIIQRRQRSNKATDDRTSQTSTNNGDLKTKRNTPEAQRPSGSTAPDFGFLFEELLPSGTPKPGSPLKLDFWQAEKKIDITHQSRDRKNATGFEQIDPRRASDLLTGNTRDALPPIALKFENYGLSLLQAEDDREKQKPQVYVSNKANDANIPRGATVFPSIQSAADKAPEGSVINVMPGVYKEHVLISRSNLTFKTERNARAILDGKGNITGLGSSAFSISSNTHDVAIKNFEIRNLSGDSGIFVGGRNINNITIAGNEIHGAMNSEGISIYGIGTSPVNNVRIISNRIHDLALRGEIEAMPINGNVSNFQIIGNSGYKLQNLFIDVIGGEEKGPSGRDQPFGGTIAYNFADGVSSKSNPNYNSYSAAGIYSDGGRDLNIYGNYIRNSDFGIEIASEHAGIDSSNVRAHGNILERSAVAWVKLGYVGGVQNSVVNNNLVIGDSINKIEREGQIGADVYVRANDSTSDRNKVSKLPAEIMALLK